MEWALTLALKKTDGNQLGTFSLHRQCNGHPLLVDVNLLISGFNTALTYALDNALRQTPSLVNQEQSTTADTDLLATT
jgi:hypothetical protein